MSTNPQTSVDALLARLDRVKNLARRLVRDAAEADDLVQEAVAAALSRPSTVHGAGDGWIAATLRNLVRDRSRGAGRRARREEIAARPEGGGQDTSLLVQNAERQRDVVEAVLSLEDPYRETLLMRFFEDLPPREIVKRTGRTPDAVKKHLDRGLAKLRYKLEKRYGDRGAWAVALLPVLGPDGLGKLGATGVGSLTSSSLVRAAAILLLAIGIGVPSFLALRESGSAAQAADDVELARRSPDEAAPALAPVEPRGDQRADAAEVVPVGDGGHPSTPTVAAAPRPQLVSSSLVLVGLDGAPLVGSEVEWTWAPGAATERGEKEHVVTTATDVEGRIEISGPRPPSLRDGPWRIDGRQMAVAGEVHGGGVALLVLAPAVRLAGLVVDAEGVPVEGASVTVWADPRTIPDFALEDQRALSTHTLRRMTGADGAFAFDSVPTDPAFRITVDADGHHGRRYPVPPVDTLGLELSIGSELPPGRRITGTVLEASGAPAAGATVRYLYHEARTDPRGRFMVQVPYDPVDATISAESEDGRFVVAPSPVDSDKIADTDREGVLEDAIVLRLPAAMNVLRGRFVDSGGDPISGCDVLVFDGTRVGSSSAYFETGGSSGGVRTDEDGRFDIERAADRPYRLRFLDRESLLVHDSGPLDPGPTEHVIVLPSDALVAALRGRVVDVFGEPLQGARVELRADENPSGSKIVGHRSGRTTTTDDQGRFKIERAPWRHLSITVHPRPGDGSASIATPIGDLFPDDVIELALEVQCRVHVTSGRDDVKRIVALDEAGQRLNVVLRESGVTTFHTRVARTQSGAFPLFDVSQRAVTLVLHGEQGEVDRIPVRLESGEQNEVTF